MCCKEKHFLNNNMDKTRRNEYCAGDLNIRLTTPSFAQKIQDIRQQLEDVLKLAPDKRSKNSPNTTGHTSLINERALPVSYRLTPDQCANPSLTIRDSRNELTKSPIRNDNVVADAKLLAYKKFISSLTRILQDTNQHTPDLSCSLSKSLNIQNTNSIAEKRPIEEKGTFLIRKDIVTDSFTSKNLDSYENQRAEKTTYCRPADYSQELLYKTLEKNARLQQVVKKLMQVREKEKQNEAWNCYINELKNKHAHEYENRNVLELFGKENKVANRAHNSYLIKQTWQQPNLYRGMCNDLYEASYDDISEESNIQRCSWCRGSINKPYKYQQNSFCCPMSSQARQEMMKKQMRGPGYSLRQPMRYFRGSSIIVNKESYHAKKTSKKTSCKSIIKSCRSCKTKSRILSDILYECRSIQTTEADLEPEQEIRSKTLSKTKVSKISVIKNKFEQVSSVAEKLKNKLHHGNNKQITLNKIEDKLDQLMASFDIFIKELKTKKVLANLKSAAVSCSSLANEKMVKIKSDTYNVFTKQNIICEISQQKPHALCLPCPITQDTVNDILNEEKYKSDQVKKDIDNILYNNCQRAVEIMTDVPTKDDATEVTNSFYKRQEEDAVVGEIEPMEKEMLDKIERSMTIAVNTDPLGILALIRVSAETVRQILSYVPNLDYVICLARRQISPNSTVARYMCNICNATFTRPSMLSDHIQSHNTDDSKSCCVCRHVLDRFSKRSGLFACAHCGQMFTRAYCRELHEQTCRAGSKAGKSGSKHGARPSLVMLT